LRALDKGAHLVLGVRPSHALADEDERPLGLLQDVDVEADTISFEW
jgi:hypothetical protein